MTVLWIPYTSRRLKGYFKPDNRGLPAREEKMQFGVENFGLADPLN
jgi:hypothetical protein